MSQLTQRPYLGKSDPQMDKPQLPNATYFFANFKRNWAFSCHSLTTDLRAIHWEILRDEA